MRYSVVIADLIQILNGKLSVRAKCSPYAVIFDEYEATFREELKLHPRIFRDAPMIWVDNICDCLNRFRSVAVVGHHLAALTSRRLHRYPLVPTQWTMSSNHFSPSAVWRVSNFERF